MFAPQTFGLCLPASPAVFKKNVCLLRTWLSSQLPKYTALHQQYKAVVERRSFKPISLIITNRNRFLAI
jgi:hypothetical protein